MEMDATSLIFQAGWVLVIAVAAFVTVKVRQNGFEKNIVAMERRFQQSVVDTETRFQRSVVDMETRWVARSGGFDTRMDHLDSILRRVEVQVAAIGAICGNCAAMKKEDS